MTNKKLTIGITYTEARNVLNHAPPPEIALAVRRALIARRMLS